MKQGLLISLAAITLFIIAYGQTADESNRPVSKHGGVLYLGVETPFHGFDILNSGGLLIPSMSTLVNLIQEPLFRMDKQGRLIPVLGLSAESTGEANIWDIH
jgi:hypothetical protein